MAFGDGLTIPANGSSQPQSEPKSIAQAPGRSYSYQPRTGELKTNGVVSVTTSRQTTVDVGGIKTSPEVAERIGLAPREEPKDELSEAKAQAEAPREERAAPATLQAPAIEPEYAQSREALVNGLPVPILDALVTRISADETGTVEPHTRAAAEAMGVPREQIDATVRSAVLGLQKQADAAITATGVTPDEFYDWAKANHPQELRAAMRQHFNTANPDAYSRLVDKFTRSVPPDVGTLEANGIETWINRQTGERMVRLAGMAMRLKVAVKCGYIRPAP